MRVSVVLCTYSYDVYHHFQEAADSVLNQTHDDIELVVVVDGSAQVAGQVWDDYGDRDNIVVHSNEDNRGLLESRNTGADLASGDVVAFIDDDAVATHDWVAELVRAYDETGYDAVGGRMVPEWASGKPSFLPEEFFWLVGVTHRGFPEGPAEVRNTFGSNISFRRDVFLDLGGFNPDIVGRKGDRILQGGETELCARLRKETGRGVWYTPDAIVAHKVFEYRTEPQWLLERAFWQGYSKRAMETFVADSTREETAFLAALMTVFLPSRLRDLIRSPSREELSQLVMLVVLTTAVGLGYLGGFMRWR